MLDGMRLAGEVHTARARSTEESAREYSGVAGEGLGNNLAHTRGVIMAGPRLECAVQGVQHQQVAEPAEEGVDVVRVGNLPGHQLDVGDVRQG